MAYFLNGTERKYFKTLAPRKIQETAIENIKQTVLINGRRLINMPCRTGKTFTTLYSLYQAGIDFAIVLCGKASAKAGYMTDSAWSNAKTGTHEGFTKVYVDNSAVKNFLSSDLSDLSGTILVEVTPQLLNKHPEFVTRLAKFAKAKRTAFVFDEAHFAEQTEKTKTMVSTITEDAISTETLSDFSSMPWIYLTASPDTQSLQNVFSVDNDNYYEVTKEMEWELYVDDLKKPVEEREFNYVPVRNTLWVMNKMMDSVFDSGKSTKQDYFSLFTQKTAKSAARKFVQKTLDRVIDIIQKGPQAEFMLEDETAPYVQRGSNINLLIKVPTNKGIVKDSSGKETTVAQLVKGLIEAVATQLLSKYSNYTGINIKDATLQNSISQEQANEFYDSNTTSINIILTQQRLIEGCTLNNLDGFLYYCPANSLVKYKQESGRTLTPSTNKRFGFIFFFDEDALSTVKALLFAKIQKIKGNKKHGPRKLSEDQAKRMTRINPAFIIGDNNEMKLINYSQSLYTKSDLENTRVRQNLFDVSKLIKIPGLFDLIKPLLKKQTSNTTKNSKSNTTEADPDNTNTSTSAGAKAPKAKKNADLTVDTPPELIETEKFVAALIYAYQDCIQNEIDLCSYTDTLATVTKMNGLEKEAVKKLYENDYTYDILMEIAEVLSNDQDTINPEA
jgi:hypothetical protein